MSNNTNITFNEELVKRLNASLATANGAIAEAACAAAAQDSKLTVRSFANALREAAPALGTAQAVLAAAVKAAKVNGATAADVAEAMASAIAKKRREDARRAADKRAAAPQKALEKAEAQVEECRRALRTPLEKAWDNYDTAKAAVFAAKKAFDEAEKALAEAEKALAELVKSEQTEPEQTETTEHTEPEQD